MRSESITDLSRIGFEPDTFKDDDESMIGFKPSNTTIPFDYHNNTQKLGNAGNLPNSAMGIHYPLSGIYEEERQIFSSRTALNGN